MERWRGRRMERRRRRRGEASVLQRVIVRGQRWWTMSSTQWLIPDPMWFMAPPRLFCRSLWCHITQAVQTSSLISALVNHKDTWPRWKCFRFESRFVFFCAFLMQSNPISKMSHSKRCDALTSCYSGRLSRPHVFTSGLQRKDLMRMAQLQPQTLVFFFKRTKYGLDAAAASVDQVFVQLNYILMHLL